MVLTLSETLKPMLVYSKYVLNLFSIGYFEKYRIYSILRNSDFLFHFLQVPNPSAP